jgi:RNA 2',3'-cyclic 3'-phosphodiesterase
MRLFVAIVPPAAALDELDAVVNPLRAARPELRWTTVQDWHLTLAFLGEVGADILPELNRRLERAAARHQAQRLAIAGGGAFPGRSRARVLWAGIEAGPGLAPLAATVAAGARRAGAPPPDEGRRYRPHLTLARCREPANVAAEVGALAELAGTPWTATDIRLIRSNLTGRASPADDPLNLRNPRQPPRYEELGAWPLRPG